MQGSYSRRIVVMGRLSELFEYTIDRFSSNGTVVYPVKSFVLSSSFVLKSSFVIGQTVAKSSLG